ncbi:MAG: hypothetical protein SF029_26150 [bacterium]|nr:hypothetical protein [bacterium]
MASVRREESENSDDYRDVLLRLPKEVWLRLEQLSKVRGQAEPKETAEPDYDFDLETYFQDIAEQARQTQQFWDDYLEQLSTLHHAVDAMIEESSRQIQQTHEAFVTALEALQQQQEQYSAAVDALVTSLKEAAFIDLQPLDLPLIHRGEDEHSDDNEDALEDFREGWGDAMEGRVKSLEDFLDELNAG